MVGPGKGSLNPSLDGRPEEGEGASRAWRSVAAAGRLRAAVWEGTRPRAAGLDLVSCSSLTWEHTSLIVAFTWRVPGARCACCRHEAPSSLCFPQLRHLLVSPWLSLEWRGAAFGFRGPPVRNNAGMTVVPLRVSPPREPPSLVTFLCYGGVAPWWGTQASKGRGLGRQLAGVQSHCPPRQSRLFSGPQFPCLRPLVSVMLRNSTRPARIPLEADHGEVCFSQGKSGKLTLGLPLSAISSRLPLRVPIW